MPRRRPRYPIYVPTKGRHDEASALTIRFLLRDETPFRIVIEREELDEYRRWVPDDQILVLPPHPPQGVIFARNWIKAHAIAEGHERHWQLDDNIRNIKRMYRGRRLACDSGPALACVEDFTDRYTNVALSGLNYEMFLVGRKPPFYRNVHVYSCTLINNVIPHQWRGVYNEDTDLCLQVLADGWCTILFNAFFAEKARTMLFKGGNTTEIYGGDGRLAMARSLERQWPGVVSVNRRFGRPQHVVKDAWKRFDTALIRRPDVDLDALPERDEYGLDLVAVQEVKAEGLKRVREQYYAGRQ